MNVDIVALPWDQIEKMYQKPKVEFDYDSLWQLEEDAKSFSDIVGGSYTQYFNIYDNTAWLKQIEFNGKDDLVAFSDCLIHEELTNDLDPNQELDAADAVFSPSRVAELTALGRKIDLEVVREAHRSLLGKVMLKGELVDKDLVPDGVYITEIAEYIMDTDHYIAYLKNLIEFVSSVDDPGTCLAIFIR